MEKRRVDESSKPFPSLKSYFEMEWTSVMHRKYEVNNYES